MKAAPRCCGGISGNQPYALCAVRHVAILSPSSLGKRQPLVVGSGMNTIEFLLGSETISQFCRQHGVLRLSLFGSHLKGSAAPNSDVDLLIEFEPNHAPGLIGLAQMEAELSRLMEGRRVDLRTPHDLSRYFRDDIMREARVQYARG